MFKRRDKKANLRRVQEDDEDAAGTAGGHLSTQDEESEVGLAVLTPSSVQKKKRKAAGSGAEKTTKALSFGDDVEEDGEGETFQIKRSAHSRKAIQQFKSKGNRNRSSGTGTYTQVSAVGSYSKEALMELRAGSSSLQERAVETEGAATQDESTAEQRHEAAVVVAVSSALKSTEQGGSIPSAELIHLARKMREKGRSAAEFLPLDSTVRVNNSRSRLVKEDDNDRSDGEDGLEYLSFSDVSSRKSAKRQQRTEMAAAIANCSVSETDGQHEAASDGDDDDGDAAIRRWEEQQMSSAASARHVGTAARVLEQQSMVDGLDPMAYGPRGTGSLGAAASNGSGQDASGSRSLMPQPSTASNLPPILSEISAASVLSLLCGKQSALQDIVTAHEGQLSRTTEDMHISEKAVEAAERQLTDASEKYNFFQESTGYISELLMRLDEKVNTLSLLEDRADRMWQDRAQFLKERRKQDLDDEAQENAQNGKPLVMDASHQARLTEREGRRKRRRQYRQAHSLRNHNDGLSSDDELTELEKAKFTTEKDSTATEATKLFEDVDDQFCDLKLIGQRFEMWKLAFRASYDEAYIPICLTKLFAPFVRLEMLTWSPLEVGQMTVEDMQWCKHLLVYSAGADGTTMPDAQDEDNFLIPNLVEKVIVTKIRDFVQHAWDPLSSKQTAQLAAVVKKIISDFPTVHSASRHSEELMQAIHDKLRMSVDVDPFIPLYTKNVMESPTSRPLEFFHRQFWSCFKLLVNTALWQGVLSDGKLQLLCLDGLVNRYLLRAIQHLIDPYECADKCAKVVELLPQSWFSGKKRFPSLDGIALLMSSKLPTMLYHASLGAPDHERKKTRTTAMKLEESLRRIGRAKEAAGLLDQFS